MSSPTTFFDFRNTFHALQKTGGTRPHARPRLVPTTEPKTDRNRQEQMKQVTVVPVYRMKNCRQHSRTALSVTLTVAASLRTIGVCGCWPCPCRSGPFPVGTQREGSPFSCVL